MPWLHFPRVRLVGDAIAFRAVRIVTVLLGGVAANARVGATDSRAAASLTSRGWREDRRLLLVISCHEQHHVRWPESELRRGPQRLQCLRQHTVLPRRTVDLDLPERREVCAVD